MANEIEKRIKSEQQCMSRLTNDMLVCKDCVYKLDDSVKLGNTTRCLRYDDKPNEVLLGGKCDGYSNEG